MPLNQLLTENIWKKISATAKANSKRAYAAVAYFGKGGSKMLPLKPGSSLVVDASEFAVKKGQTYPNELLKLYNQGVKIYSREFLHAKVFVLGNKVFIGSTNVSSRSANKLVELVFTSNSRHTINEAKAFVKSLCKYELGPEELKQLQKIYRPPIVPGNPTSQGKSRSTAESRKHSSEERIYVANLTINDYAPGFEEPLKQGMKEAQKKWQERVRHFIDEFEWRSAKIPFRKGDLLVQVVDIGDKKLISAPGKVLHIKKWKNNRRAFIFLEQPNKRRKNIKTVSKPIAAKLKRDGFKSKELSEELLELWQ